LAKKTFNILIGGEAAVALKAGFAARSFSGMPSHVTEMILKGMAHKGFALIDILQPCVTFNKVNNFAWYKKRCYELKGDHDPNDWDKAIKKAAEWGDKIPVGVIYMNDRSSFEERIKEKK
jgi:2-oxoglutarate ferredoxin oxidoreductase subunit beta